MGYTRAGLIIYAMPDSSIAKLLPGYNIRKYDLGIPNVFALDFDLIKDPDSAPFKTTIPATKISENLKRNLPKLAQVHEGLLAAGFERTAIYGEMNLAVAISQLLNCKVISFTGDDDGADCFSVMDSGQISYLREFHEFVDIEWRHQTLNIIPLQDEEMAEDELADATKFHKNAAAVAQKSGINFGAMIAYEPILHRLIRKGFAEFTEINSTLLGIGGTYVDPMIEQSQSALPQKLAPQRPKAGDEVLKLPPPRPIADVAPFALKNKKIAGSIFFSIPVVATIALVFFGLRYGWSNFFPVGLISVTAISLILAYFGWAFNRLANRMISFLMTGIATEGAVTKTTPNALGPILEITYRDASNKKYYGKAIVVGGNTDLNLLTVPVLYDPAKPGKFAIITAAGGISPGKAKPAV